MHVVELRNPRALLVPDLQNLLRRAVESGVMIAPLVLDDIAGDIVRFITDENNFFLLGAEKGEAKAIMLGSLPTTAIFPYPTCILFYNEGSRQLSRAMTREVMDLVTSHGYTRLIAVNSSAGSDEVWQKALTPEGAQSYVHGSLVVFEVW